VIEERQPVADTVVAHWMNDDVGDFGASLAVAAASLSRLGVVARVVADRLLGLRPGVFLLAVGQENVSDGVGVMRLEQLGTLEAFDVHGSSWGDGRRFYYGERCTAKRDAGRARVRTAANSCRRVT